MFADSTQLQGKETSDQSPALVPKHYQMKHFLGHLCITVSGNYQKEKKYIPIFQLIKADNQDRKQPMNQTLAQEFM